MCPFSIINTLFSDKQTKLPVLDKLFDWFTHHEESTNKCGEEKLDREDAIHLAQEAFKHRHITLYLYVN